MAQLKSTQVFGDLNVTGEVNASTKITVNGEEVWDTGNFNPSTKANTSTQVIAGTGLTGGGTLAANRTLSVNYGTAAGTAAQGNDSRIVNAVPNSRTITAGTGLTGGGNLTANRTLTVSYGTAAGTAAQGNDSRINNGQTAFGWGNHASAGYAKTKADVGLSGIPDTNASTANFLRGDGTWVTPPNTNTTYAEITTAEIDAGTASTLRTISGRRMKHALDKKADTSTQVIAGTGLSGGGTLAANRTLAVSYGTAAGTAAQGNDSRLSNSREWTASDVSQAEAQAGTATTARKWTAQRVAQAIIALGLKIGTTATTAKAGNWMPTYAEVTGKPTTFTPTAHTHSLSQITDAGSVASLNTNASTANFLRGDGTWVTPPNTNTTYTEITTAEIDAGTASTLRTITGRRMKHALDKKSDTGHTHTWAQVTGQPATATRWPTFAEVTDKPTNYATTWNSVASKPAQATRWPTYAEVTGKPATFPIARSTNTVEGGIKSRVSESTLWMTNDGSNA